MIELGFLDAQGRSLPVVECGGVVVLPGPPDQEYQIRVINRSDVELEVLPFVDGLDLETGRPGELSMIGRRIPPRGDTVFSHRRAKSPPGDAAVPGRLQFRTLPEIRAPFQNTPTGTLGSVVVAVFLAEGTDSFDDRPVLERRRAVQHASFPQPHHQPLLLPYQYR
jgi:hypothetical protein